MKSLFKNPLFYTNILLLTLVVLLAQHTPAVQAKSSWLLQQAMAAIGQITGGGTINFLARFAGAGASSNEIGDSIVYDDGADHVGIGTTNPSDRLSVRTGTDNNIHFRSNSSFGDSLTTGIWLDSVNDAYNAVRPLRLRGAPIVLDSGSVGIGVINPVDARLVVDGSMRLAGTNPVFRITHTPGAVNMKNFQIQTDGTTLYFGSNNDGWGWKYSDILTLNENGNVGIGGKLGIGRVTDSDAKLQVNGSMILTPVVTGPASPVNGQMWLLR